MLSINGKTRSHRSTIFAVAERNIDSEGKGLHLENKVAESTWRHLSPIGTAVATLTVPAESDPWHLEGWPKVSRAGPRQPPESDPWHLEAAPGGGEAGRSETATPPPTAQYAGREGTR